jgi:hypothetical protein
LITAVVLVFSRNRQTPLVPTDFDLIALESWHFDAQDELTILFIEFVVVRTGAKQT